MIRTLTQEELFTFYGDPSRYVREDGGVAPGWETEILSWCHLPAPLPLAWEMSRSVIKFRCHKRIALGLESVFRAIALVPEAWATLGDFGGCYAWRTQRGSRRKLSLHCWGLAVDSDVADNPMGGPPRVHPVTLAAFEAGGFFWGGNFSDPKRKDPQHWEKGVTA